MAAVDEASAAIRNRDGLDDVLDAVSSQLSTAGLVLANGGSGASSTDRQFLTDEEFWRAVYAERLRSRAIVRLTGFSLLEWFPRSPGRYHTEQARESRRSAFPHLQPLTSAQRARLSQSGVDDLRVYNLEGKSGMLEGGYGCVRLRDKLTNDGRLWFMTASSSTVAHEGIPVGLPDHIYDRFIDAIANDGAVVGDMVGRLTFVPEVFAPLYAPYRDVPQLYLRIEDFHPCRTPPANVPRASAAVTFAKGPDRSGVAAAFVEFQPGAGGNIRQRLDWLQMYVEELHDGRVITDFDEHMSRFGSAAFSLERISRGELDRGLMSNALDFLYPDEANVYIDNLVIQQGRFNIERARIREIRMGDTFSNIGAGATIINRSLLSNALNRVSSDFGDDAAVALRAIAEHVQLSGSRDAAENLEGMMEELDRTEPRKSRLRSFWNGLVDVLPGVAQLGDASAKIVALLT